MIKLSKVASSISISLTRKLFNMAKEYDDVIDFTLGDPDVPPHDLIKQSAIEAILAGKTRYSSNAGLIELRQSISNYVYRKEHLSYDPNDEIVVTVGAMEGLYLTLLSLLDPGDEVIIPEPYWINYKQMTTMCHATPVIVGSKSCDLSFPIDEIEAAITPRSKVIIINNPSNPSGMIISNEILSRLANLCVNHNLIVISDEVYKTLKYGEVIYNSIVNFPQMRERTILINSLSKEFAMTGWRIGYVLAPKSLVAAITPLQENIVACAPLPSQYAAITALENAELCTTALLKEFRKRRDVVLQCAARIDNIKCSTLDATFYAMLDIRASGLSSEEFAYDLLKEAQVAVVPGVTYGNSCEGYVRIAYTLSEEKIKTGFERIASYMQRYK